MHSARTRFFLGLIPLGLLVTSALILTLIYGPIVHVELQYQYRRILTEVFHVSSLRALIFPQVDLSFIGVQNQEFGMQIPALHLDEPIVFNVDPYNKDTYNAALKKGIAHAAGTELPPYAGLGYYFAHSSQPDVRSQYNAVFYLLGKLKKDDEIYLWFEKNRYAYRVTDIQITEPSEVGFLQHAYDQPTIVLQTCWPPGSTQKRLLVFAERGL